MIEEDVFAFSDGAPMAPPAAGNPLRAQALLVRLAEGGQVAFAPHHTLEVLEDLRLTPLPGAPRHVHGLLAWRDAWVALLDLQGTLHADSSVRPLPQRAMVLGYMHSPGAPMDYVAIGLESLPASVEVTDADACALPEEYDAWRHLCLACFAHDGRAIPVLDVVATFRGSPPSSAANPAESALLIPAEAVIAEESAFDSAFESGPEDASESLWAD